MIDIQHGRDDCLGVEFLTRKNVLINKRRKKRKDQNSIAWVVAVSTGLGVDRISVTNTHHSGGSEDGTVVELEVGLAV